MSKVSQSHPRSHFLATAIDTTLTWGDLVVDSTTMQGLVDVRILARQAIGKQAWTIQNHARTPFLLSWFQGPAGTGKTLSACLLGKDLQRPVFRAQLSSIFGKDTAETATKLRILAAQIRNRDWLLFLDSETAGETVNGFKFEPGMIAQLAASLRASHCLIVIATETEEDFTAGLEPSTQSTVHFAMPDAAARLRLWKACFAGGTSPSLAQDVDLPGLTSDNKLSGGSIVNVARYATLLCSRRGDKVITSQDLQDGIRQESFQPLPGG